MELHAAEVWLTDNASLVVTIPYAEHDLQPESELRERLFRAVNHRFKGKADEATFGRYVQCTQLDTLQIIEDSPLIHSRPQYGVVLARSEVRA